MNEGFFTDNGIYGIDETEGFIEIAWNSGKAFADWLPTTGEVVVFRRGDANEQIVNAIVEGVRLQGRDVVDAGNGDGQQITELITSVGYSGGIVVGGGTLTGQTVVELYNETGALIDAEHGLQAIAELVNAGNFVPSRIKGELKNDIATRQ